MRSEVGSQRSEVRGRRSEVRGHFLIRKLSGFLSIFPSIFPISFESVVSSLCFSMLMYLQSKAKSSEESFSLFSPSQSVSLLMK